MNEWFLQLLSSGVAMGFKLFRMSDSDQFSRESLEFTYELLRNSNPQLALDVRNLALVCALEERASSKGETVLARVCVDFDVEKVREIVACLKESYSEFSGDEDLEKKARLVVQDWILLAQKQFVEGNEAFRSLH